MKSFKFKVSRAIKGDQWLWLSVIFLMLISLVAVYSAIGLQAITKAYVTPWQAMIKHLRYMVLTFLIIVGVSNLNYRMIARFSGVFFGACLAFLAAMLVMGGRWFSIPFVGHFQPSEFAKVALILLLAKKVSMNKDSLDNKYFFAGLMINVAVVAGLILPENFSTAALVVVASLFVMYYGGIKRSYVYRTAAVLVVLGVAFLFYSYRVYQRQVRMSEEMGYVEEASGGMLKRTVTWGHRVDSWLFPKPDDLTQENMARMAVATGRLTGNGVGNTVHARLMREADNDFIFSIIIEETGFLGALGVLLVYLVFFWRCVCVSNECKGLFGSLVSVSLGTLIFIQAAVNMAVAVGALPVTGQTLPLISRGGSALLAMGVAVGVIQSVAKDNALQRNEDVEAMELEPSAEEDADDSNE